MYNSELYYYEFGQISLSLPQAIINSAQYPRYWRRFEKKAVQTQFPFSVLVKDSICLPESGVKVASNGWVHTFQNGKHWMFHLENGKPQCAFMYEDFRHFSIIIHRDMPWHYRQISILFAMLLGLSGKAFGLHGVTVICQDRVVILVAPSGTGKSTLGRLLHEYCDAAIVNGDFALLTPEVDGSLMFEPTPFCGSSGICHNYRLKVDRIVFLEQAKENTFSGLTSLQAITRLLSNTFVPTWDGERALAVQQSALQAVASVSMNVFAFAPTGEAAKMFHNLVTQA